MHEEPELRAQAGLSVPVAYYLVLAPVLNLLCWLPLLPSPLWSPYFYIDFFQNSYLTSLLLGPLPSHDDLLG